MKKLLSCLVAFLLTFTMASCTVVSNSASGSGNSGSSSGTEDVTPEPVTLAGKQVIFLGSSLTVGDSGYSMCEYLEENHNSLVTKWAVSGTWLIHRNDGTSYVERLAKNAETVDKCDFLICQLSTNGAGIPIGEVSDSYLSEDFDTTTIIGAIEYVIAKSKETWGCPVAFYTVAYHERSEYASWISALYKVQQKWNKGKTYFGVIDLFNDEEFNNITDEQRAEYFLSDGVHIKKKAYKEWWGPRFAEFLLDYYNN